jgi:uncharacterized protein YprB with RNaseH-like and TPR domain
MNLDLDFEDILFLDIETVPVIEHFEDLDDEMKALFERKTSYQRRDEVSAEDFYERAGIWAEFGKIICISVGFFHRFDSTDRKFRVTSFHGEEPDVLTQFSDLLIKHFSEQRKLLCAHNGKEFDFPYIARRMIINGISIPEKLRMFGKKPWEIPHLDTMELWKFGDFKHYTSLKLLTRVLGIPSPKTDIDGHEVARVYYEEKDMERIVRYCEGDVVAIAQIMLRFGNEDLLDPSAVVRV